MRALMTLAAVLSVALAGCASTPADNPVVVSGHTAISVRSAAPEGEQPNPADVKALEKTVHDLLLKNLPDPLVQSASGWGKQKDGVVGVNFKRTGLALRTEQVRGMRNDGMWRRISVRAVNPQQSLRVGVADAAYPEPGRTTFTTMIGTDCDLKFEQQLWRNGTRLYSGETRGRCHAAVLLKCEVTSRTEAKPGSLLPDLVFRVRVTEAQLFYDHVVIEHTAGVGGDAAKVLGDAVLDFVKRAKPDLERNLLAKANAAIVKAADTKEVRVSFESLMKGEGPAIVRSK
jgi:hypothetical protein